MIDDSRSRRYVRKLYVPSRTAIIHHDFFFTPTGSQPSGIQSSWVYQATLKKRSRLRLRLFCRLPLRAYGLLNPLASHPLGYISRRKRYRLRLLLFCLLPPWAYGLLSPSGIPSSWVYQAKTPTSRVHYLEHEPSV